MVLIKTFLRCSDKAKQDIDKGSTIQYCDLQFGSYLPKSRRIK